MVRLISNMARFNRMFQTNIRDCLNDLGRYCKNLEDDYAAVDTGFMQSCNDFFIVDEFTVRIGNFGVEYNIYIEFGTSKMIAQPFVRPTAFNHQTEIIGIAINSLRRGIA